MNELILAFFDIIDGEKPKTELLQKAKELQRLKAKAKAEAMIMDEDQQDEFALGFGDKFFEILRKTDNVSNN